MRILSVIHWLSRWGFDAVALANASLLGGKNIESQNASKPDRGISKWMGGSWGYSKRPWPNANLGKIVYGNPSKNVSKRSSQLSLKKRWTLGVTQIVSNVFGFYSDGLKVRFDSCVARFNRSGIVVVLGANKDLGSHRKKTWRDQRRLRQATPLWRQYCNASSDPHGKSESTWILCIGVLLY